MTTLALCPEYTTSNNNNKKKRRQYEALALFINSIMMVDLFRLVVPNVGVVSVLRDSLYVFGFLYMLYHSVNNHKVSIPVSIIVVYSMLAILTVIAYPGIGSVVGSGSLIFITRCVPAFYFVRYLNDYILLRKVLKKYYMIQFVYCIIYIINHQGYITDGSYMTFSYNILLLTVLLLLSVFEKPSLLRILGSVFFVSIILIYGARGPIACIGISLVLFVLYKNRNISLAKRIVLLLVISLVVVVIITSFDNIISILRRINPSSRTLYMIEQLNLFDSSGRSSIHEAILSEVNKNWLLPHGIYSDRVFLATLYGGDYADYYSHNIGIELLYQFGGVLGVLAITWLVSYCIRADILLNEIEDESTAIMFFGFLTGISTLLFSSSYLINERGWLFMGFVFAIINTAKKSQKK